MYSMYVQYVCTVCMYSTYVQYVRMYSMYVQYVCTVHMYSTYVCTVCRYSMYVQFVCMCVQYTQMYVCVYLVHSVCDVIRGYSICNVCCTSDLTQAKASGSQVMVVGTHFDTIPGPQRTETRERLKSLFAKEYLGQVKETMSLRVDPHLRLVNTLDSVDVQSVRDAIYDCALSSCPSLGKSEFLEVGGTVGAIVIGA